MRRYRNFSVFHFVLFLIIVSSSLLLNSSIWASEEMKVHFIDVGQGDCILLQAPDNYDVLLDCGSLKGGDEEQTRSYIETNVEDKKIEVVVVTHPDGDHYNMLPYCVQDCTVDQVLIVRKTSDHKERTIDCEGEEAAGNMKEWLETFSDEELRPLTLEDCCAESSPSPSEFFNNTYAKFYIIAAKVNEPKSEWRKSPKNTESIVLLVSYDKFQLILSGDATTCTEKYILGQYAPNWLDCDVLKVGHHGSQTTSVSDNWAKVVKPEISIICAHKQNSFGHPGKEVIDRLDKYATGEDVPSHSLIVWKKNKETKKWGKVKGYNKYKKAIFSTATNGTVLLSTDGQKCKIKTSNPESEWEMPLQ